MWKQSREAVEAINEASVEGWWSVDPLLALLGPFLLQIITGRRMRMS